MNILFLALEPPSPPNDGGRIRTFNILKQVALRHRVTLICFDSPLSGQEDLHILRQWCERVIVVPKPASPVRTWLRKIVDLPRREPVGLSQWFSSQMAETLRCLVETTSYDLAHIDQIMLAQYANILQPLSWVLTHHNVEGLLQQRELALRGNHLRLRQWSDRLENRRWMRYEIGASRRANAILTVSGTEAEYFRNHLSETPIFVVPNGVDTNLFQPVDGGGDRRFLLFTGQMNYAPNVDAAVWFCRDILPLIRQRRPDLDLVVVGRDPSPEVKSLAQIKGVTVTGRVEDVRPFYDQAVVFVVPLRFGAGTRLKILEAMSMGMPIVSTSIGCEGLDLSSGADLLVADSPRDFATAVMKLVENSDLRDKLAVQARNTVIRLYDWNNIAENLEHAYQAATVCY